MTNLGGPLGAFANDLLTLGDLDWVGMAGAIIGIANFQASGTDGMSDTDITFGGNWVAIDFNGGAFWQTNSFIAFDLVTQHVAVAEPYPNPVPLHCLVWA